MLIIYQGRPRKLSFQLVPTSYNYVWISNKAKKPRYHHLFYRANHIFTNQALCEFLTMQRTPGYPLFYCVNRYPQIRHLQVHTNHKEKNFSTLCMCQCSNAAVNKMLNMQDHWSHKRVLAASFLASIPAVSISSSKRNPEMFISWGKHGKIVMWKHDISSSVYRDKWLVCNANCILLVL